MYITLDECRRSQFWLPYSYSFSASCTNEVARGSDQHAPQRSVYIRHHRHHRHPGLKTALFRVTKGVTQSGIRRLRHQETSITPINTVGVTQVTKVTQRNSSFL